jgi:hypothetical protein
MSGIPFGIEQTLAHLHALGFYDGSRFYGRVLLPRELQESEVFRKSVSCKFKTIDYFCDIVDERLVVTRLKWVPTIELKPDGTPKFTLVPGEVYQDGYNMLRYWNRWGGIYFYPNQGGRFNREVTACQSAYFESDDGDFDAQWAVINEFGSTTGILPTSVIKTRKSLHVYYRFPASEWETENWTTEIQRPLALAMRSDPAIQNTARLMRLAGFHHVKWVDDKLNFVPVTLEICEPERQYTREQLKDAIASVLPQPYSEQRFKFWVYLNSPAHKGLGVEIDSEIALSCPESDLEETERRWRRFIKLSRDKANGKDCDPHDAFTCDLKKLPRVRHHETYEGEIFEGERNTIIWARFLYGYDPIGRGDWITAQDPLIPESERHLHSIDSLHIHKITGAIKSHRGSDPKDIYERMKEIAEKGIYRELTQLTEKPWKEINTAKLDLEKLGLEPGAIYIVCSAKGTHKTNSLVPFTPQFKNVYAWFSRIALGREECERIGLDWKDDIKAWAGGLKVGFCADSSFSFSPGLLKNNGLLLCDEADQVFEHMFGDTCNKGGKRPLILAALKAQIDSVIVCGGMALFMSADITDKEVAYIKQLAPDGCPVRLIVNNYEPQLGKVNFDESEKSDGLIEELLRDLESGQSRFVIDDMKGGVNGSLSIAEYIRTVHPEWADEIVEINSDTSGDPKIIEYLKNINTASLSTRLLCCSPSVVSGVSIENGHFSQVYGFFNGVMTVSHASQALARVRGAEAIQVWAADKGVIYSADRSLFPEQIKGYYQRNYEANSKHILAFGVQYDALKDEWDSPHFDLYCKYAAYRNNCMDKLRARLKERLTDEGYQVFLTAAGSSDKAKEGLQDAWTHLEIGHAHAVAQANILTDAQLEALENVTLTPNQKLDVEKTYLLKSFGQELIDNMVFEHSSGEVLKGWPAIVLKDKRGEYRKQLEAFYLLTSDVEIALAKDLRAEERQLDYGAGRFAGDVRWFTRQRKSREFLGLHEFLNPESWWGPADFADLAHKAKKNAGRLKDALGFAVQKMTPGQIFGELMGQLGLELDKRWAPEPSNAGRRYKFRQINPTSWRYAQMYLRYRDSLLQPQEEYFESSVPAESGVCADHPSVDFYSEGLGGGDQGLSHEGQGTEVVSSPHFFVGDLDEKSTTQLADTEVSALSPETPPQQSPAPAKIEFQVGDAVAHAEIYMVAYSYHGIVEEVAADEILVRWAERQGKPNECERYHTSELRRLDEERARHLNKVFKGFSAPKLGDPSLELESVTSSEQMDHQTPIDLFKGFSAPKPGAPSLPEPENIPPVIGGKRSGGYEVNRV